MITDRFINISEKVKMNNSNKKTNSRLTFTHKIRNKTGLSDKMNEKH